MQYMQLAGPVIGSSKPSAQRGPDIKKPALNFVWLAKKVSRLSARQVAVQGCLVTRLPLVVTVSCELVRMSWGDTIAKPTVSLWVSG